MQARLLQMNTLCKMKIFTKILDVDLPAGSKSETINLSFDDRKRGRLKLLLTVAMMQAFKLSVDWCYVTAQC